MSNHSLLLAGCGDIALRLADQLLQKDQTWSISGLRRQVDKLPGFINPIAADLSKPVSILPAFDYVVVTMTPSGFDEDGYRQSYVEGTRNLLNALPSKPKHLLWISSTAVYGQSAGEWVDEESDTSPSGFSGQVMLEAEQLVRDYSPDTSIVRFSGIYGPGRNYLLNQVREGNGVPSEPVQWTNRIHADDCAGVLAFLLYLHLQGKPLHTLYLATDNSPVSRQEVEDWLAGELGVALSRQSQQRLVRGNRRCSNQRLRHLGYQFQYPDYRAGYRALIAGQT